MILSLLIYCGVIKQKFRLSIDVCSKNVANSLLRDFELSLQHCVRSILPWRQSWSYWFVSHRLTGFILIRSGCGCRGAMYSYCNTVLHRFVTKHAAPTSVAIKHARWLRYRSILCRLHRLWYKRWLGKLASTHQIKYIQGRLSPNNKGAFPLLLPPA